MESEMSVHKKLLRGVGFVAAGVLAGQLWCAAAFANGPERGGGWLRSHAGPVDRQMREPPAFMAEPARRPDMDDSRNPRRWSPEERRQLRRDVHDAGRDVYGNPPPRRPD